MKTFVSHGRHYEIDDCGAIHQTDAQPFNYDKEYVEIYDRPEYVKGNDVLQALRIGFISGVTAPRSILDYGCGNGAFIKAAGRAFNDVKGYDVTGVKIPGCNVVDVPVPADVYTFWDCLEHLPDLSILKDLPCNYLFISLPYCHFHALGKSWFDNNYRHRKPDEHLHHFTPESLIATLAPVWRPVALTHIEDIVRTPANGLPNIITAAFKHNGKTTQFY